MENLTFPAAYSKERITDNVAYVLAKLQLAPNAPFTSVSLLAQEIKMQLNKEKK